MAERKNIAAFTPPGVHYPPYVSVNETDGQVEITVRSPAKPDGSCGDTAAMNLSLPEFKALLAEAGDSVFGGHLVPHHGSGPDNQ